MSRIVTLHFVRHVPVHNPHSLWYGPEVEIDTTSRTVQNQFKRIAQRIPHNSATTEWISSPYTRAVQTAQGVGKEIAFQPDIEIMEAFIEQNYGAMTGLSHKGIREIERFKPYFEDMWGNSPPNGESMSMFQDRVFKGMMNIIHRSVPEKPYIVIFSHGGVLMAAFAQATGRRMIDVFEDKKNASAPSFSYMSLLTLPYHVGPNEWLSPTYHKGIPKHTP